MQTELRRRLVQLEHFLDRRLLALLADILPDRLIQTLEDQRHAEEERRLDLLQILLDIFESLAVPDASTLVHRHQKAAGALIGMVDRQHTEESIPLVGIQQRRGTHQVAADIRLRKHDALGDARRAGGKEQRTHLVRIDLCIQIGTIACCNLFLTLSDQTGPALDTVRRRVRVQIYQYTQLRLAALTLSMKMLRNFFVKKIASHSASMISCSSSDAPSSLSSGTITPTPPVTAR